jgi:hypothetical protein
VLTSWPESGFMGLGTGQVEVHPTPNPLNATLLQQRWAYRISQKRPVWLH